MMHRPWDCAQPDEWLPRSLRLCWGGDGDGGGGFGGDSGGDAFGGDGGFGGATTGGGDWGSSGSYDASAFGSGMDYASALANSPGGFYDTGGPGIAEGALGAEFGGAFGLSGISGQPGTNAFGAELDAGGGNTSGVGNAIASWSQSTAAGGPGAGTNVADVLSGGMFGDYSGGGGGYGGGYGGGGGFGGFGTGYGGGGGGYTGGGYTGGGYGGNAFGSGTLGASNAVSSVTGSGMTDTSGAGSLSAGSAASSGHSLGSQAVAAAASNVGPSDSDAAPSEEGDTSVAPSESSFGEPATSEAAPEAEAGPSLSDGAPAGNIGGKDDAAPASQQSDRGETEAPSTSAFGPQSLAEGMQTLSDLTQTALDLGYQGAPYADMGPQDAPASFDSRFGFDVAAPQDTFDSRFGFDTSAPAPSIETSIPGDQQTDFDYGPGQQTAAPNFDQVFADLGIAPGWNPAEQLAGVTGLAEPTDWAGNPYAPGTDVSVGRDFNQAFGSFDTPTGMDLAGDMQTQEGDLATQLGLENISSQPATIDNTLTVLDDMPGVTTNLADQLGIGNLTIGHGIGGHVVGVTGLNYAPQVQLPDPRAQQQPVEVELVPADQVPTPPPPEVQPPTPQEAPPQAPQEAPQAPQQAPQEAPQQAPQEAPQQAPQEAPQAPPQEVEQAPPSLIEMVTAPPPQEVQPTPPSLIEQLQTPPGTPLAFPGTPATTLPPDVPAYAPQSAPAAPPPADEHEDEADPHANTPSRPGTPLGAPTTGRQNTPVVSRFVIQEQQGKTRDRPVSEALHSILSRAAEQAGVVVRVGSGGQIATRAPGDRGRQGGWTGSVRHNHGNAADIRLEQNGRILNYNNPQDRVVMENFVREAARLGATGMGAGMNYMGPNTIHVGFGNPSFWRADNPGSRGLQQAWNEGRHGPANRPPADIPVRQAQAIPLPGRRPADAPQPDAPIVTATPTPPPTPTEQPPAEVPVALPPQQPAPSDRPPADIPMTLTPPRAGRADPVMLDRAIAAITTQALKGVGPQTTKDAAIAKGAAARAAMIQAGIPGPLANAALLDLANKTAAAMGYARGDYMGMVGSAIDKGIAEAMQGYKPAAPGPVQGPPSPFAPGRQGALPSGQQYADLSQSLGPQLQQPSLAIPGLQDLSPLTAPPGPPPTWGRPPAIERDPNMQRLPRDPGRPPTPGQFSPFRGNEAALPGITLAGFSPGSRPSNEPSTQPNIEEISPLDPRSSEVFSGDRAGRDQVINPDVLEQQQQEQQEYQQDLNPRGWQQASLLDFLSNFNPISTAEAKGRGRDVALERAMATAREGGNFGGQPGMSVVGKNVFTFYAPGASGSKGMEGPMIGSKGNPLTTLDDVRNGAGFVSLAGHPAQFGQQVFIGNITYTSPVDGKQYTLNNVVGRVDDTGGKFGGRDNPYQNHFDIAVGDFSRGWNDTTAGRFVASNYATAVPGRGIGSDFAVNPDDMPAVGFVPAEAPPADMRGLAKGGHVAKNEKVVVGEEGPEYFVPDEPGTVVPHMPQARRKPAENVDRWPKGPAVDYPGRYGGVEREILRQTRAAQNPVPTLIDLIDSGRLPLNAANWHAMMNDPSLIALGRSRMDDRRAGIDPGAEQYGAFIPPPEPAAEPPDPENPMAQALGYGSIRRPLRLGRQSY